ncbi:Uncharacterized protein APZ42_007941, partial [Daphnia magna]
NGPSKVLECSQGSCEQHNELLAVSVMQKGTVCEDCWNTVKGAGENKMIGGYLRDAKGNGLIKVLERSQWSS